MPPSADDLTGPELEELQAAILDAFPVKAHLEQLVKFEFDVSLASVADGDSLTIVVFRLIEWADANGKIEQLVAATVRAVPDNPKLRAFVEARGKRPPAREPRRKASGLAPGAHGAAPASPSAGGDRVRLLVIGTFCVTALFAVCIVFVMVLVGVLPASQLWIAVVPVGLLAALAFRMAPRHGSLASA